MNATNQKPLELWGGVECTINRVGDRYFSQLARNQHRERLDDLDRFAELGLRVLRFPILWEDLDDSLGEERWQAIDAQLARMRSLGMRPVAGLVHHGSGPSHTTLIDPRFPEKLAAFASTVAQRYPWIDAYTPVNEPLTTARFSGLYAHWYPHGRDGFTFVRALLNQLRGVALSMRAVREFNPAAVLVQTDDLGKTFSSPKLQYQADFENERRWLTWDLLAGRVGREHPMWRYLLSIGADERDVAWFAEDPCPPDIIGVNHYVTSERYLDEHLRDHPPATHGGNGWHRYADVSAVRARLEGVDGPETLLREAVARYALPIAVTEAHLGCTREEQLRWLAEIWTAAQTLHCEGNDVRAVTVWSLLGAFNWDSLLTRDVGSYEPGVYDLRGGAPRETAIAKMVRSLASTGTFEHPVMHNPGWWRRRVRLRPTIAARSREECPSDDVIVRFVPDEVKTSSATPLLITGARGTIASEVIRAAELRGLSYVALAREELDVADAQSVSSALESLQPWAIVNCAGFSRVDDAEAAEQECVGANAHGTANLASACAAAEIPLLTFSSDHVFDGDKGSAYVESDSCSPLNVFGTSRMLGDLSALTLCPKALLVRPGKLLAPFSETSPLVQILRQIARGEQVRVANDVRQSVSFLPEVITVALDMLIDAETGVWHVANTGIVTPFELVRSAAQLLQLDSSLVEGVPEWTLRRPAPRARNRALLSERAQFLAPLSDALARYCAELPPLVEVLEPAIGTR
ncbi:MAG: sugar nucleotide-binding protein [Verrucomicrobiota bacterium]|nr:sugar nucleotide-binding protein [Verrucomicrobiota bacterium]